MKIAHKIAFKASVLAALCLFPASVSRAVVVAPGDQHIFLDTTDLTGKTFAGTTVSEQTVAPTSDSALLNASDLNAMVVRRADTGTLDYYFSFESGTQQNSHFDVDGFGGSTLDIYQYQEQSTLPILPTIAYRSGGDGSDVTIATPLGSLASYFVLRSSETFLPSGQTLTFVESDDTGGPDRTARYDIEFSAPVPEPSDFTLILFASVALMMRHRIAHLL